MSPQIRIAPAAVATDIPANRDVARVVPGDAKMVKMGGTVLGYSVKRRKPRVSPWKMNAFTRRTDLQALVAYCLSHDLALGPDGGWAMVIGNMCRVLYDHVTAEMIQQEAAAIGRPPISNSAAIGAVQEIMGHVWGNKYPLWTGDVVGAYIEVTIPVREEAGLQKIEAMEETGAERRRRENRERMRRKRAAEAALPKLTKKELAANLGVSLRTLYRMIDRGEVETGGTDSVRRSIDTPITS